MAALRTAKYSELRAWIVTDPARGTGGLDDRDRKPASTVTIAAMIKQDWLPELDCFPSNGKAC